MKPKFGKEGACLCGHPPQPEIMQPGYGMAKDGRTLCIDCLTEKQKRDMEETGKGRLIAAPDCVRNEAGTLRFDIQTSETGGHNIAGQRQDIWFIGPDDMLWQGTRYGDPNGPMKVRRCSGLMHLRAQLQDYGMTIYLKDGEYRVNFAYGDEATAHYTNCPVDAFHTGVAMAKERDKPKPLTVD
jgi:hypothetical protein